MSVEAREAHREAATYKALDTVINALLELRDGERLRVLRTALAFLGIELASADHFMVVLGRPDGTGSPVVGEGVGPGLTCGPGVEIRLHNFAGADWLRKLAVKEMPHAWGGERKCEFEVVSVDGTTDRWKWLGGAKAGTGWRRRQLRALAGAGKRPSLPP